MAKVKLNIESRVERLRRLSVVWASPLQLKIVTELYLREMSPKQFHAEFGGGSLSRVDKTFKKLAKHGWLRHIRSEGPGGHRRGGVEHFYRATELAIFDDEIWKMVPYSMRVAISWMIFKQLAERVRYSLQAGLLTARAGSHLGSTTIVVDRLGWERIVAATGTLFESAFEEQADARIRIQRSGETPIRATIGLAAFESPVLQSAPDDQLIAPRLVSVDKDCPVPFSLRVSKAIADDLCLKIIDEANRREISVPLFHEEFGGDTIEGIRRRFRTAERCGWLKRVGVRTGGRRRSAVENFYRATGPVIIGSEDWAKLPAVTPAPASWSTFLQLAEHVKEAIEAGTFEARLDNHFSWSLLHLDQQGWQKVIAENEAVLAMVFEEWVAADVRLAASGEEPIAMTVALAAFESPRTAPKEP